MNVGRKGKGSGRSGLARNKLFGALGHVHNPFSTSSRKDQDDDYRRDDNVGTLRTIGLEVEMTKAEAIMIAQNLVARFQKC
jgi:hypothetical protein